MICSIPNFTENGIRQNLLIDSNCSYDECHIIYSILRTMLILCFKRAQQASWNWSPQFSFCLQIIRVFPRISFYDWHTSNMCALLEATRTQSIRQRENCSINFPKWPFHSANKKWKIEFIKRIQSLTPNFEWKIGFTRVRIKKNDDLTPQRASRKTFSLNKNASYKTNYGLKMKTESCCDTHAFMHTYSPFRHVSLFYHELKPIKEPCFYSTMSRHYFNQKKICQNNKIESTQ